MAEVVASASVPVVPVRGAGDLLQVLRDGTPRTRNELIELTGLARSTVGLRVDALLASGLLAPSGRSRSTGGRPPAQFAFNPAARLVLAADFGATHLLAAVTDLNGQVLAEDRQTLDIADGPEACLKTLVKTATKLLDGRPVADLAGVGIGVPGPVEHSSGRPVKPPIMPGWDGFDIPGWIREHLDAPVLVDNDVNLMALGEHSQVHADVQHMVFVKVATGIGAGIISGGRLHRGAEGSAGDLGHVQSPHGSEILCHCGNYGCLEAMASGRAIAGQLREAGGVDVQNSRDVLALLAQGDQAAAAAVRRAGRDIGEVLATCVSLLNPSVIVIGGSLAHGAPSLLAGVREVIYARSLPLATGHLLVVPSATGEHAGVHGAAAMVIQQFLAPESIDAMFALAAG